MANYARNPYDLLGVTPSATHNEIRRAYLIRVRVLHPDRFSRNSQPNEWEKANEMLQELNAAYQLLDDPERRAQYDASHFQGDGQQPGASTSSDVPPRSSPTGPDPEATGTGRQDEFRGCVQWEDLPKGVQQRLLARQNGETGDQFKTQTNSRLKWISIAVLCLIWGALLFVIADQYRWTPNENVMYLVLTLIACAGFSWSVQWLKEWRRSSLKPFVYVTPLYLIRTYMDEVSFRWLWDLQGLTFSQRFRAGTTSGYYIAEMKFRDALERFRIRTGREVRNLQAAIRDWASRVDTATRNHDSSYFLDNDDFLELRQFGFKNRRRQRYARSMLRTACVGLAAGVVLFICGNRYNEYCDDRTTWQAAVAFDSAYSYRHYLATHSVGRWASEANANIDRIYEKSRQTYITARKRGYDRGASDIVLGLLTYARATRDYKVAVAFHRQNEIPPNIEHVLRRHFGVPKILPVDDAFSDTRMAAREGAISKAISEAFGAVIPGDVLEFRQGLDQKNRPAFLIEYIVEAGKYIYYRVSDEHLDEAEREYYPGVFIGWKFEVAIPQVANRYEFALQSQPAQTFQFRGGASSERDSMYDGMCESAFSDLGREIVKRFGLQ